jgi:hypothetical protein
MARRATSELKAMESNSWGTRGEPMTDLADDVVHSRRGLTDQACLIEKAALMTTAAVPDLASVARSAMPTQVSFANAFRTKSSG